MRTKLCYFQRITFTLNPEEQKRLYMDISVSKTSKSAHTVKFFGSLFSNVSFFIVYKMDSLMILINLSNTIQYKNARF